MLYGVFTNKKLLSLATGDKQIWLDSLVVVPGVKIGLGAVLFCQHGNPMCLEIYTFGDNCWDGVYSGFSIQKRITSRSCRSASRPAKLGVRFCSVWAFRYTVFNEIQVVLKCVGPVLGCKNTCPINQTSEPVLVYFRGQINSLGLSAFMAASGNALKPNHAFLAKRYALAKMRH